VVSTDRVLVDTIRARLAAEADPVRAPQTQAYMKSEMPYLGVPLPRVRAIVRAEAAERPPATVADLTAIVRELWRPAVYREERYAATELTGLSSVRKLQTLELLPLYQEMIVTGAWWDHVDGVAHRIGGLLLAFPSQMRPTIVAWSRDPDRWLRRTSIICQLDAKDRTDLTLLSTTILANADDPDFFLRKAIGWALRQYARVDPDWVRRFVAGHMLSPLSQREATKHLGG
jgi:3-methyladenine DNA glycosylase AlkD